MKQRGAAKRDTAEAPIISALEANGFRVYQLTEPCDLACRKDTWAPGIFQFLEVKTGYGKAARINRDRRQKRQVEFIQQTGTPIVRTPDEALYVLNILNSTV